MTPLQESIEVWRGHLAKAREGDLADGDVGVQACPLCKVFHDDSCVGCPVSEAGHWQCGHTPYLDVDYALEDAAPKDVVVAAVEAEIAFLEGLRGKT